MLTIFNALAPIFALIALGYLLRKKGFLAPDFWAGVDRLNFYVLFPVLLVVSIGGAELDLASAWPMGLVLVAMTVILSTALILARPVLPLPGPAFTSVFQGAIRWNAFLALAAGATLFGDEAIAWVGVAMAFLVPPINVFCVVAFARYGQELDPGRTVLLVLKNPIIIGTLLGIAVNLAGTGLPGLSGSVLELLGRAALPLGLLSVGAGLSIRAAKKAGVTVLATVGLKQIAAPLVVAGLGLAIGLTGLPYQAAVLCAMAPTAMNSYVMARQLGGDAELMASIITGSTLMAMVTMPVMLLLLT